MKRTSLGLFLVLATAGLSACTAPADSDPSSVPAESPDADPMAERLASGSLQSEKLADDIRRHDAAKAALGDHPEVMPAVHAFNNHRLNHGVSEDETFKVRRVSVDETGAKHVRLDHYYKGIRVIGSTGMVRADRDGVVLDEEARDVRRGVALDTKPSVTAEQARKVVEARPERTGTPLLEPRSELVIYPIKQRVVIATGAPVTGQETDLDALDVENRVVAYKLAYQIETVDHRENGPVSAHRFFVDAQTGEVLNTRKMTHEASGTGWTYKTNGPNNDFHVPITTTMHNSTNFEPWDTYRNFGVWDDDFGNNSGPNWDMNNLFGDGAVFAGDANATYQNRQTAIADVLYAMQVTWNMFDRVWNWRGYNNNFYEGDAYVHVGTEWDNASYNSLTGNISIGDSSGTVTSRRTHYNTPAHEFGHGFDDFNSDIGGSGEPDGISEAAGDIISEVSEMYEIGLGDKNASITIPAATSALDWKMPNSNRDFKTGNEYPYWTTAIADDPDEHRRAVTMDHAFYFLSQGSSSNPFSKQWSMYVPWGMAGVGIDHAARIWIRAMLTGFNGNQDYADARASCLTAASQLYGSASAEYKAVQNAFAAIHVGSAAAGYPGAAVSMGESEPNNSSLGPDPVASGTLPAGAPVTGALYKRTLVSGGVSSGDVYDWYSISVPSGKVLRATLFPWNDANLAIYDDWDTLMDSSVTAGTATEQAVSGAPADGYSHLYTIRVSHASTALGQIPFYQLYVDLY